MMTILVISGLVVMTAGLITFLLPPPAAGPTAHGVTGDIAKVIEEVTKLLDKLDKRYRPGLILMLLGLALVAMGIYVGTLDAKEAAESALGFTT